MKNTPGQKTPLTAQHIEALLDRCLDVEFSFIKTETPARILAQLEQEQQAYILSWVQRVAGTNIQLAYQFITHAIDALEHLNKSTVETWALHAMDTYDKTGLHAALEVIRNVDNFVELDRIRKTGVSFEDRSVVLQHFIHGLSGRKLNLKTSLHSHTDTETLYVPELISTMDDKDSNFLLYKASVALLWAQTRFGTFAAHMPALLDQHKQDSHWLQLFHCMETLRLESCIQRELPGLYRSMTDIKSRIGHQLPPQWLAIAARLSQANTGTALVFRLSREHLGNLSPYEPLPYQGILDPEKAIACIDARLQREKARLRTALFKLQQELGKPQQQPQQQPQQEQQAPPQFQNKTQENNPQDLDVEITLDDQPVQPPESVKALLSSIQQDLGEIPDEYLVPAGPGEYDPALLTDREADPSDVWKGTYHEEGAFLYNEWDYRRQHYRKNWCAVRELELTPRFDHFARDTLNKYSGLIKHLRRTFEALRDEHRNLKRQSHGENIDLDAVVEALADCKDGREMSEHLFSRMHRVERNIAVCFMVDMSGSTKGWINDAERESLLLLCETLETLGDRYAIYGFSGMARKRCEIYKIKQFHEPYNNEIKGRISAIEPKDYTRMGFAIRHLGQVLNTIEARTRILIALSDGKPDDYDNYRGEYGIEDTRRALMEVRRSGIHPYCITIDKEAKDYLPHMYGPAAYTVIDEVSKLPMKVSDIYRRLTT